MVSGDDLGLGLEDGDYGEQYNPDDGLSPIQKLQKYMECENFYNRYYHIFFKHYNWYYSILSGPILSHVVEQLYWNNRLIYHSAYVDGMPTMSANSTSIVWSPAIICSVALSSAATVG